MLGLSLGSGIAAAIIGKVDTATSVSLRRLHLVSRGRMLGLPSRFLSAIVPPIWNAEESLRDCPIPSLIVHGEKDPLFPVRMADDLASACGANAELIVVPNLTAQRALSTSPPLLLGSNHLRLNNPFPLPRSHIFQCPRR